MKRLTFYMQQLVARILLLLIEGYRLFVSPLLAANCRHLPTCSQYAKDAVSLHGPLRGCYYTLKRIVRCHPWANPMIDPVPPVHNVGTLTKYIVSKNRRLGE